MTDEELAELAARWFAHGGASTLAAGLCAMRAMSPELRRVITEAVFQVERKLELIEQLVCDSAPLAWVAGNDMDAASKWEQRAHAILNDCDVANEPLLVARQERDDARTELKGVKALLGQQALYGGEVEREREQAQAEVRAWRAAYDNVDFGPQTPEEVPVFLRERDKVNGEAAAAKIASLESQVEMLRSECVMLRVDNQELLGQEQVEYSRFWYNAAKRWNDWAQKYVPALEAGMLGHDGRRAAIDELIGKLRADAPSQSQSQSDVGPDDQAALRARVAELERLINAPHIESFLEAVRTEAAHQSERWGTDHDEGKAPQDWFWLLGFLAGKAVAAAIAGNRDKALHHTISSAAVLLNWHAHMTGARTAMRPGIATPKD